MKFVTLLLSASILTLCGACSSKPTRLQVDSGVRLACQLPPPPWTKASGETTRALVDAWEALAKCRKAIGINDREN